MREPRLLINSYFVGGGTLLLPLPLGEVAPGQGVPDVVCDAPGLLPGLFPAVAGDEPGFDSAEFDVPGLDPEGDDPGFDEA